LKSPFESSSKWSERYRCRSLIGVSSSSIRFEAGNVLDNQAFGILNRSTPPEIRRQAAFRFLKLGNLVLGW
jgi:hypothetical protein